MNKKITIKTDRGEVYNFIIDPQQEMDVQLTQLLGGENGHGITYRMTETQIQMVDYYYNSVIGAHEILSVVDTNEPVSLQWNSVKA